MKVSQKDKVIISSEKIKDYLLSSIHPIGRFKAVFFYNLGYSVDNWGILARDIKSILKYDVKKTVKTEYGVKYEIHGLITGPNNKSSTIITVWIIINNEQELRFVTAYPGDKK